MPLSRWLPALILVLAVPRAQAAEREGMLIVGDPASHPILPPLALWNGSSRALRVPPDDPWATDFEKSGGEATSRYAETLAWIDALIAKAPELHKVSIGTSPQGREIWMVIASASGASTPEALQKEEKPVLLVQAGIHAGEIDGKDAGLMLLRDMTVKKLRRVLLDDASLLFIPILNVDGHERFGPYGRINQRGPAEMGWRTNARNLNLNRDYAKLDTPEIRAMVRVMEEWEPDLVLDIHVTDGMDYEYDVTWGYNGPHAHSPNSAAWLDAYLTPVLEKDLETMGHVPGPLVFPVDEKDLTKGNTGWTAPPRFSNGYGDLRHVPTVLVENHSLKPYEQRVLGTYVLLDSCLRTLGRHGKLLRKAIAEDQKGRRVQVPLAWKVPEGKPTTFSFRGIRSVLEPSAVTGGLRVVWKGEPETIDWPLVVETEPKAIASRPLAYWVPATHPEVIERLALHGIAMERIEAPREVSVTMYRIEGGVIERNPFEGHARVLGTPVPEAQKEIYPAGSVRVSTDQPLGDLAILLLEPGSPDSFFQWGFFLETIQRAEYVEAYIMEPMAEEMLASDPDLAREFKERLADPVFAADQNARLEWFYRRTPFFDERYGLYPVGREE